MIDWATEIAEATKHALSSFAKDELAYLAQRLLPEQILAETVMYGQRTYRGDAPIESKARLLVQKSGYLSYEKNNGAAAFSIGQRR